MNSSFWNTIWAMRFMNEKMGQTQPTLALKFKSIHSKKTTITIYNGSTLKYKIYK